MESELMSTVEAPLSFARKSAHPGMISFATEYQDIRGLKAR
jgi:hypothetical protein